MIQLGQAIWPLHIVVSINLLSLSSAFTTLSTQQPCPPPCVAGSLPPKESKLYKRKLFNRQSLSDKFKTLYGATLETKKVPPNDDDLKESSVSTIEPLRGKPFTLEVKGGETCVVLIMMTKQHVAIRHFCGLKQEQHLSDTDIALFMEDVSKTLKEDHIKLPEIISKDSYFFWTILSQDPPDGHTYEKQILAIGYGVDQEYGKKTLTASQMEHLPPWNALCNLKANKVSYKYDPYYNTIPPSSNPKVNKVSYKYNPHYNTIPQSSNLPNKYMAGFMLDMTDDLIFATSYELPEEVESEADESKKNRQSSSRKDQNKEAPPERSQAGGSSSQHGQDEEAPPESSQAGVAPSEQDSDEASPPKSPAHKKQKTEDDKLFDDFIDWGADESPTQSSSRQSPSRESPSRQSSPNEPGTDSDEEFGDIIDWRGGGPS